MIHCLIHHKYNEDKQAQFVHNNYIFSLNFKTIKIINITIKDGYTDVNGTVSGDDISITINNGDTLSFDVNAPNHPFYIKTVQGTGTDNQASNVTNNGTIGGVVNWTPTGAGTYYYQCSVHDGMYGTITVQ